MTKTKIPQFDRYVCVGDSVAWSAQGFDIRARVEFDSDSNPADCDCYTPRQIQQWKEDEWFYCGIILEVEFNGVKLSDHAASLWGVDCNFPSRRKNPNWYLSDVCAELESEAIDAGRAEITRILSKLSGA